MEDNRGQYVKEHSLGAKIAGFRQWSAETLLANVLEQRGLKVNTRPYDFRANHVEISFDRDAYKIFDFICWRTPEFRALEEGLSGEWDKDYVVCGETTIGLENSLSKCEHWPDETKNRLRAYFWENVAKRAYGKTLDGKAKIEKLRVITENPPPAELISFIAEREAIREEENQQILTVAKARAKDIMEREKVKMMTSSDVKNLFNELIDRVVGFPDWDQANYWQTSEKSF